MSPLRLLLFGSLLTLSSGLAHAFDHTHSAWQTVLARHVKVAPRGNASFVDYKGIQSERNALRAYLNSLSAVSEVEYRQWPKPQRLAFLINAYNAFTIDLVLSTYPGLESIKDAGTLFQSPWKRKFFQLLGKERSLDDVEHGLIRAPGAFDDPRIHFAVVCASIGCPMLRPEAFTAERLELQLDDSLLRFMSDNTRNRFDVAGGRLMVSKIFDWYGSDFEQGHKGFISLKDTFARFADQLATAPEARARIRAGVYHLEFLDYDWRLNDVENSKGAK